MEVEIEKRRVIFTVEKLQPDNLREVLWKPWVR